MKNDRFLTGILIFIAVLVVAAVALFFVRDQEQSYSSEDKPEGVLSNYVLALEKMDYPRAYAYLADGEDKPSYEAFRQAFLTWQLDTREAAMQIGTAHVEGEDAWVEVSILHAGSGPFDQGWSSNDRAILTRQNEGWKITYLPYPFWGWDWYLSTTDPMKAP